MSKSSQINQKLFFLTKVIIVPVLGIIAIALIGQLYAALHPGYQNIILEPDPVVGWKFASNIEFIHTGDNWYANELSVHHKTNSLGFLGEDRSLQKPSQGARVVLMGDSFVEALQVPPEKSAAGVLERQLNLLVASSSMPLKQYEVFNFGISNLSVGQYLLIWEKYASKFSPDYVFIFVAGMQMERTTQKKADWGTQISRPRFELVKGKLVQHPVDDYEKSLDAFHQEIKERRGRTKKREQKIWIVDWVKGGDMSRVFKRLIPQQLRLALKQIVADDTIKPFFPALKEKILGLMKPAQAKVSTQGSGKIETIDPLSLEITEDTLKVNLSIIEKLDKEVAQAGGRLIVVDASLYFWFTGANEVLTRRIKEFCQEKKIDYIPLYQDLLETDRNNLWARFPHSHHFNEHGNAIFANKMLEWIKKNSKQ